MKQKSGYLARFSTYSSQIQFLWKDIKEAIAGTERDFTETKLGHAIFILAV